MEQDNEINNTYRKGYKASPTSPASPALPAQSTFRPLKGAGPINESHLVKGWKGNARQYGAAYTPVSGPRVPLPPACPATLPPRHQLDPIRGERCVSLIR